MERIGADAVRGADILLTECGRLQEGERVVIVCDSTTRDVGRLLEDRARSLASVVELHEIPPLSMHGMEPPAAVGEAMARAQLCIGVTASSMAHTRARRAAAERGTRYLSLPDYSIDLLEDPSLRVDFRALAKRARELADAFTRGSTVRVTSRAGTDIKMRIDGRTGNAAPGFVEKEGDLGSPPDVEANVSPVETSAEGIVVVDGSIPFPTIGLLTEPVSLLVTGGMISTISGDAKVRAELERLFEGAGARSRILAECGVGLNDRAQLRGVMLTDEGCAGTMHFGFGSNATVGGLNDVPFHLDVVFRSPTLTLDGVELLRGGELLAAV